MKKFRAKLANSNHFLALLAIILFLGGLFVLWIASLRIPALESISERKVDASTKIYDRTGEILLYDLSPDVKRQIVPFDSISPFVKKATLAIEDKDFYSHHGFVLTSFLRAVLVNVTSLSFSQGGSTITQQVVKNSILTKDKTPTRKLKELILALKLERVLSKDEIFSLYLNEIPYGGTLYGVEEASENFFGKSANDLTLAEAAYLAAIPKAPTHYSPYGSHLAELENRKNLVLKEMLNNKMISQEEYDQALQEKVVFKAREDTGSIKAPHFVFFVIDRLVDQYGEDVVRNSGWKIISTLDYTIQKDAESIAKKYGEINQKTFNADNDAMVAIDPKTGEILAMVGSRNYFDKEIGGNFNAATSHRQPGSTFKPFVYSVLLSKGFTDRTIFWDVPTQFSPNCSPDNYTTDDRCYSPGNYDDKFRGPMTMRSALAQSINLPAVEAMYLAGVRDSISFARDLGIESLTKISDYGLSLVLGGGSVSLLDMTSAYSVYANDGVRNAYTPVLSIEDGNGNVIDQHNPFPQRVIPEQTVRMMNNILSDNSARTPGYGPNSPLYISNNVAVKTGTSNDYRDAWIIGYSPNLVVGAWVGNNDNSPMAKKVAGLIVSPMWRELMDKALPNFPNESFIDPETPNYSEMKPVLRGETGEGPHSLLYWVDKDNPQGPVPTNPGRDPQFNNWEYSVERWALTNLYTSPNTSSEVPPATNPEPVPGFIPVPTTF